MSSSEEFREYAKECERIAKTLPPEQRARLMEIAKAWIDCAEQEEERMRSKGQKGD
jgi:hypothetical protein